MKIHEYQAKALLREFVVPVPNGDVADTPVNGKPRITKCCTEVCPEHIHITDNGIIPLKERMADNVDPIVWLLRKFRGGKKKTPA